MDRESKSLATDLGSTAGLFVHGVVISNGAKIIDLKNGTILVFVKHEVALDPGLFILERFIDPEATNEVEVVGDEVKSFPELKKFEPIIAIIHKIKEYDNQMSASEWDLYSVH